MNEREELQDLAAGTLQEWFTGYSPPLSDGAQVKVTAEEYYDDGMTFVVTTLGEEYDNSPRRYRAFVTIEESP